MDINLNAASPYISSAALPPVTGNQTGNAQADTTASASTTVSKQSPADNTKQDNSSNKNDIKAPEKQESDGGNAYFDVDDDKNVVIKVTDSAGKVVKQIPAEDYLQMVKVLDENAKNLLQSSTGKNMYHKEA
ncbi:MAG: flagellar protein FlaG [Nitrospirae bacterium]|nr:flagellar protein FlaG [Nitrospirota bacterium]